MSTPVPLSFQAADFAATGQLQPADLAAVAAAGYRAVINNRPDGEGGAQQPSSTDMEAAARAAGLQYVYLPVVSGQITLEQVQQMAQALRSLPAPVLAFCRSGARSTQLYQFARQIP